MLWKEWLADWYLMSDVYQPIGSMTKEGRWTHCLCPEKEYRMLYNTIQYVVSLVPSIWWKEMARHYNVNKWSKPVQFVLNTSNSLNWSITDSGKLFHTEKTCSPNIVLGRGTMKSGLLVEWRRWHTGLLLTGWTDSLRVIVMYHEHQMCNLVLATISDW